MTLRGILHSSTLKLSAVHFHQNRHPDFRLSRMGPRLSNNFRGSIHTPSTCLPRLPTFVSAGRRVRLPGWWLAFAHGRIFTSWIATTGFIQGATLESQQLRHSSRQRLVRLIARNSAARGLSQMFTRESATISGLTSKKVGMKTRLLFGVKQPHLQITKSDHT